MNDDLAAMLDFAESHGFDQCDYCKYTYECNHHAINCYGGNPVESKCVSDPENWVDEDTLREMIEGEDENESESNA